MLHFVSASGSNFNPRNIQYIPVVEIFAFLELEQKLPFFKGLKNMYATKFDELVKSHFASDIEQFWKKIQIEPGVKNCKLFEGVSPRSCNLAR